MYRTERLDSGGIGSSVFLCDEERGGIREAHDTDSSK